MSGHSKWATIKRKKEQIDSRRGAAFTKLSKNISVAAKGGKDPDMNPALRTAIENARAANMPKDNIEKAILKGAGEIPGAVYEEVLYEAYGPGGVAMIIECVTDNTNRTVSFVRSTMTKAGSSLGSSGSVLFQFEQKGMIRLAADAFASVADKDELELELIDAGAEDIDENEDEITIVTSRESLHAVSQLLADKQITVESAALSWMSSQHAPIDEATAEKLHNLIDTLEGDDDVVAVHTNAQAAE